MMSEFTIENGVLKKYAGEGGDIVIPEGVTDIRRLRFFLKGKTVTSLRLPRSLTRIPDQSFKGMEDLETVILPDTLTHIGNQAFAGCKKLKTIKFPDSLEYVGFGAFEKSGIEDVELNENAILGKLCFRNTPLMDKIHGRPEPETKTHMVIYRGRVLNYFDLTENPGLVIPEGVTAIEEAVFSKYTFIKSVSFPSTLRTIGPDAFRHCDGISEITVPEGVRRIGSSAFEDCTSLRCVHLPASLEYIAPDAFLFCENVRFESPDGSYAQKFAENHKHKPLENRHFYLTTDYTWYNGGQWFLNGFERLGGIRDWELTDKTEAIVYEVSENEIPADILAKARELGIPTIDNDAFVSRVRNNTL